MSLKLGVNFLFLAARNHALADGDKQLALAAVIAFCGLNGRRLTLANDEAYDLVISVAPGNSAISTPSGPSSGTPHSLAGKATARSAHPSPKLPESGVVPCWSTVMAETFLLAEEKHAQEPF